MIYLLRKLLSQHLCSQPFPWCPVGQLEQPLTWGTIPNYPTGELHNTHRCCVTLCCHTPFNQRKSSIFSYCFLINLHSLLLPLSLFLSSVAPVGLSDSMAPQPFPYSHCNTQVIRLHYEDICATLINKSVVLPPNLFSPFLSCPSWSSGCGLLPSTNWRLPLHCSSFQIADVTLLLHSPNQVLTVNLTSPSSRATINQKCCDIHSVQSSTVSKTAVCVWHSFDQILICMHSFHAVTDYAVTRKWTFPETVSDFHSP